MRSEPHDTVIIGSGPAGYTAAIYAARARLNPVLIEGSTSSGGALMNTTDVENFPGFGLGITGPELMAEMRKQAERFGATIVTDDVMSVRLSGELKTVEDSSGNAYAGKTVILAMGSRYRALGLSNEERLSGLGVSWCATCDGAFYGDQRVAVVGGGDSAMEEATFLTRFAERVYIVHRRDELRASKAMQERAFDNPKIEFVWNTEVLDIVGGDEVKGLLLRSPDKDWTLDVTGVFIAVGHEPRSELVRDQVICDDQGYVKVAHPSTRTNVEGVFAAGDLVDHIYRQAITAAGTGCAAALDVERYLSARPQGGHS